MLEFLPPVATDNGSVMERRGRAVQRSGELTGRVPSIKTLAQTHGVAMGTAERALTILRDEGLITMVIGRGAFVRRDP